MRWVVKLGSSSVTEHGQRLADERLCGWAHQIAELVRQGHQIVVVSSGAVAAGMARLARQTRPTNLAEIQALAAIGQSDLVQAWRDAFEVHQLPVAQVLLNHSDISNRERYLNARNAITLLLEMPAVPIVNENDTVATDEIRLGDNDTLAALVANLIDADGVLLLTDQDGLFTANPAVDPAAELISERDANDPELDAMVGDATSEVGTGGMSTKLKAARMAARSGASTIIANARRDGVILQSVSGEALGTRLTASIRPFSSKKQWLADHLKVSGAVIVDDGARRVLREKGASLLPVGIIAVNGYFGSGENVVIESEHGEVIGRGLSNFSSDELQRVKGMASNELRERLGYETSPHAIHRDNMVVF